MSCRFSYCLNSSNHPAFQFLSQMDITPEGSQYVRRYHVHAFPHIGIIDPRTARLVWKKEGWTQENPVTAETFAEMAMDFCSRNSFDRPPQAPRPPGAKTPPAPRQTPLHELSEEEQLKAAMQASMEDIAPTDEVNDESYVEYLGAKDEMEEEDTKPAAVPSFIGELLEVSLPDEPAMGPRVQFRMPDGKRVVRRFNSSDPVKALFAFLAQSNDEAKQGREFILMAGYPPKDLRPDVDKTVEECQLSGQAITVRWKD
jgi:hypothetical protein